MRQDRSRLHRQVRRRDRRHRDVPGHRHVRSHEAVREFEVLPGCRRPGQGDHTVQSEPDRIHARDRFAVRHRQCVEVVDALPSVAWRNRERARRERDGLVDDAARSGRDLTRPLEDVRGVRDLDVVPGEVSRDVRRAVRHERRARAARLRDARAERRKHCPLRARRALVVDRQAPVGRSSAPRPDRPGSAIAARRPAPSRTVGPGVGHHAARRRPVLQRDGSPASRFPVRGRRPSASLDRPCSRQHTRRRQPDRSSPARSVRCAGRAVRPDRSVHRHASGIHTDDAASRPRGISVPAATGFLRPIHAPKRLTDRRHPKPTDPHVRAPRVETRPHGSRIAHPNRIPSTTHVNRTAAFDVHRAADRQTHRGRTGRPGVSRVRDRRTAKHDEAGIGSGGVERERTGADDRNVGRRRARDVHSRNDVNVHGGVREVARRIPGARAVADHRVARDRRQRDGRGRTGERRGRAGRGGSREGRRVAGPEELDLRDAAGVGRCRREEEARVGRRQVRSRRRARERDHGERASARGHDADHLRSRGAVPHDVERLNVERVGRRARDVRRGPGENGRRRAERRGHAVDGQADRRHRDVVGRGDGKSDDVARRVDVARLHGRERDRRDGGRDCVGQDREDDRRAGRLVPVRVVGVDLEGYGLAGREVRR